MAVTETLDSNTPGVLPAWNDPVSLREPVRWSETVQMNWTQVDPIIRTAVRLK